MRDVEPAAVLANDPPVEQPPEDRLALIPPQIRPQQIIDGRRRHRPPVDAERLHDPQIYRVQAGEQPADKIAQDVLVLRDPVHFVQELGQGELRVALQHAEHKLERPGIAIGESAYLLKMLLRRRFQPVDSFAVQALEEAHRLGPGEAIVDLKATGAQRVLTQKRFGSRAGRQNELHPVIAPTQECTEQLVQLGVAYPPALVQQLFRPVNDYPDAPVDELLQGAVELARKWQHRVVQMLAEGSACPLAWDDLG